MGTRKVRSRGAWRPPLACDENVKGAAADAYRRGPDFVPERPQPPTRTDVVVLNSSGAERAKGECLQISATPKLTTLIDDQYVCDGIAPTNGREAFGVLLEPIANAAYGRMQVSGIALATVTIGNTNHTRAYLPNGEYKLKSAQYGPVTILQRPASSGDQTCVVLLRHESPPVWRYWSWAWEIAAGEQYGGGSDDLATSTGTDYCVHPGFESLGPSASTLTCTVGGWYHFSVWFQMRAPSTNSGAYPIAGTGVQVTGYPYINRGGSYHYPGDILSQANIYYVHPTTGDIAYPAAYYSSVGVFHKDDIVGIEAFAATVVPVGCRLHGNAVIGMGPRVWKYP